MIDKTKLAKDVFNDGAKRYQEKFMHFELYNDTLNLLCNELPEDASILELGCGPGNLSYYIKQKVPNCSILGIDVSDQMIKLAQQNLPTEEFRVMDIKHIGQFNQQFNAIVGGFCLPYLSQEECKDLIAKMNTLLLEGGLFYLSTMEGDYSLSGLEGKEKKLYVHYHKCHFLIEQLTLKGFEIVHQLRKAYPEQKHKSSVDLILIGKKAR